jgi:hypothetical protein
MEAGDFLDRILSKKERDRNRAPALLIAKPPLINLAWFGDSRTTLLAEIADITS